MIATVTTSGRAHGAAQQDIRPSAPASTAAGRDTAASSGPAVITVLSDGASALPGGAGGIDLPKDFDTMVQRRTEALAARMTAAFDAAMIRVDEALALRVDRYGTIEADGPQKKKIEKLMRDDPELAREFRTVAALNATRAVAEALRLHAEEMKAARNPGEKRAADDRHAGRTAAIHAASGSMTLTEGRLVPAAMVYMQSDARPEADVDQAIARWRDQKTDFLV